MRCARRLGGAESPTVGGPQSDLQTQGGDARLSFLPGWFLSLTTLRCGRAREGASGPCRWEWLLRGPVAQRPLQLLRP